MRFSNTILLSILSAMVSADCTEDSGNYFCDETSAVVYSNIGYDGSYMDVTDMDESSCECTQSSTSFSGTNSPLDEELSVHFRGPIKLLQFGVYKPSGTTTASKKKRDVVELAEESCSSTQHIHHAHKREAATEIVEVTSTVYVNGDGNTITSSGTQTEVVAYAPSSATLVSDETTEASSTSSPTTTTLASTTSSEEETSSATTSSSTASSTSSSSSSSSDWDRVSYYSSSGTADNVVFLNTLGGTTDSGTWSSCFGNSLSYCASDGTSASSSAETLDEVTTSSDTEYMIFSKESCDNGDDGCGYYRSDIPAYHGFGGSEKIFVFEFEMPNDSDSSGASNPDMPAIWLLNAKIPRTLQYGDSTCSCWSTGCGEMDLFEVLIEGDDRLISHLHDGQGDDGTSSGGGGSSDYFARPTSSSMKAAAVFASDGSITIVQLDDDTSFDSGLDSDTLDSWLDVSASAATLV